jgi:hypothetical protein
VKTSSTAARKSNRPRAEKRCRSCHQLLPLEAFGKGPHGRRLPDCLACANIPGTKTASNSARL